MIDLLNMFKLVSTICAAHHRFVSNRVACLTHISKCVSVQFFPLLKSSVFYSLALKKGSNNFASGSSFCSRRFVLSFLVGSLFFTHGYIVFYLFLESVSTVSYSRYYVTYSSYYAIHGLRTPNEGMNQRNLKIWANVAGKICFSRT